MRPTLDAGQENLRGEISMIGFIRGVRVAVETVSVLALAVFSLGNGRIPLPSWWWLPGRAADSAYRSEIAAAANRYDVDPLLFDALVEVESGYDPTAVSEAGAMGLAQLMPDTAASLGLADPFDPAQNLDGGARYLAQMLAHYDGNVQFALAAYNAGPGTVDDCHCLPNNYADLVLSGYERRQWRWPLEQRGTLYQEPVSMTQAFPHGLPGWEGVDLHGGCDTPLTNPLPGTAVVTYNGLDGYDAGGYGESSMLTLKAESGMELILLHGVYFPATGATVHQGDVIGLESDVGWATGCHQHMILRVDGSTVNYLDYFEEDVR